MPDIEIKRGYEVLPDNNIRFGIRITNISELALFDVEVILDFTESLFKLEGERLQKIGVIPSANANSRTAEFILKPLGCVHQVNIEGQITYRDAKSKKYRIEIRPKEVHCVCPFLKGKKMPRAEFLELSSAGHSSEMGLNFKGVTVERLTSFLVHTCKSRHYKVDDFSIEGGRMLYLASESIGEKAYYLLTALIKEEDDLTQVMLRAVSDKPYGLNGFLNETVTDLRHVVETVKSAREIGVIRKEQVINIIDSVVQRTTFGGGEGGASVNIKDSVVQRTKFKGDEEKKKQEEERQRKEGEEQESLRLENEKKSSGGGKWVFGLIIIFAMLALGWYVTQDSSSSATPQETTPFVTTTPVMIAKTSTTNLTPKVTSIVSSTTVVPEYSPVVDIAKKDLSERLSIPIGDIKLVKEEAVDWPNTGLGFPEEGMMYAQVITPGFRIILKAQDKLYEYHSDYKRIAGPKPAISQDIINNSIGMEFVSISPGEFEMGSPSNEVGRLDNEGPVHHVTISKGFYMGKYEVTQKQWRDVMGSSPSINKGDNLPIEEVSWNDVQDFIKKLNEKEGVTKYRLPSEAEWEYSARAGTTTRYSFGDDESILGDYAWYSANSGGKTNNIGQKKPNPWGLYDMHGNVWEWVQDNWHANYNGAPTNGSSWESGSGQVYRGGGWDYLARGCRSAFRSRYDMGYRIGFIGFRLLREV
ncbi:MAG: formylglycine-generating enzyme family protein [Candidatus Methanoperedens sp.]